MSFGASLIHAVYRRSGVKKLYSLPEDELLKAIEKANRGRGFFLPADHKAYYEKKMIGDFPCLIVRAAEMPAKRAILFFFGGDMVIGPDSDVRFPIYPPRRDALLLYAALLPGGEGGLRQDHRTAQIHPRRRRKCSESYFWKVWASACCCFWSARSASGTAQSAWCIFTSPRCRSAASRLA